MIKRVGVCILLGLLLLTSALSAQESTPTYVDYTVQPGDNLTAIAARFGTTTEILLAVNNIANPNRIQVGMVLRIPLGSPDLVPTIAPSATPGPSPTPAPTAAPLAFDVGGEVVVFDHAGEMRRAGMTWAKITLRWSPGDSLDGASQAIEGAQVEGFNILLQISGNAETLKADPASYIAAFAEYLQQVASLAPDGIEVWSEMNLAPVSPTIYARLLRAAYEAIKRGNASTLVVSGALGESLGLGDGCDGARCDELAYLRQMATAGVEQYADCIGMRYTLGALAPAATSGDLRGSPFIYYYPAVVTTFANVFPTKPLCFTGLGYYVRETETVGFDWAVGNTLESRADWLAQAVTLARETARIRLLIVYRVDDGIAEEAGYAITSMEHFCLSCLTLGSAINP